MAGPLDGVRILELPAVGPVPFLGMMLADLGAEMIRVDKLPGAKTSLGDSMVDSPLGRGHRSIGVDLKSPDGVEVVLRLIESCDGLIEGFRPGVTERLGIGPDAALARNPKLVYGRMTGWGQHGPLASTAGHDITYLAITGLLHGIGPGDGAPIPPINYVADFGGGAMFLAMGLLAGILHVRAGGAGQVVDTAMTEGAGYLGSMTRAFFGMGTWQDRRGTNVIDGGAPNYRCYECADGRYLAVGALEPQFWATLVGALGMDVATTPSPYDPAQWDACAELLAATFKTRDRDEWAELFAPLDACVAPVLSLAEAPTHPHNLARGSYVEVDGITMPGPAPKFSVTPGQTAPMSVVRGDTDALLGAAGYDAEQIARLRASGAVG